MTSRRARAIERARLLDQRDEEYRQKRMEAARREGHPVEFRYPKTATHMGKASNLVFFISELGVIVPHINGTPWSEPA